ncbi:CmpA/NrtA family ABC transporter substrate-binding protein [Phenylobacterium deserti]|uniref:Thiamine biosynthesis protein n=1 Tax=Phenylobacterium deserti TaxID=1914756 RepID=A0A328AEZ2_9CAUL|nr:CmpA/NrtA family ABC transporter substrate-binding protein [Phenylobacterium deserti]RAK51358.1 thiamine biosynthesis protein [Phenylobacterium deserti]
MRLKLGFVPLTDAAPLIVAQALGFFADEGLTVELSREVSWATVRDKVAVGALDGAHMLAPMALAANLGLGSEPAPLIAPMALSHNGAAVTLASRLLPAEEPDAAGLARLVRRRKEQDASPLTFAVVFPYSIHNYLLRAWMAQAGIDPDLDVRLTVAPPPRMAELLAGGVIEGFCAGEPWSTAAATRGVGRLAVRAGELWGHAPDKVLGVTDGWAGEDPARLQALVRALLRAAAWADSPAHRAELAHLLAEPQYVGVEAAVIEEGLRHIRFHADGANVPKLQDAAWLLEQMVLWGQAGAGLDIKAAAARVYRPDLFEAATTTPIR